MFKFVRYIKAKWIWAVQGNLGVWCSVIITIFSVAISIAHLTRFLEKFLNQKFFDFQKPSESVNTLFPQSTEKYFKFNEITTTNL